MSPEIEKAWFFYERRRYEEALAHCHKALASDPHDAQALWLGGLSALLLERSDEALEMCRSLLANQPDSPEGHELMGHIVSESNEVRAAERHFREAVRLAPERAELYAILGNFLGRHGRLEDGITFAHRGLTLEPENPAILQSLEQLYRINKEPELAEKMGARALAADPEDANSHLAAGLRLLQSQQSPAASASFREALRLEPAAGENLEIIAHERVRNHWLFRNAIFLPIQRELLIVTLCVPLVWWLLSLLLRPFVILFWLSLLVVTLGYLHRGLFLLSRWYVLRGLRSGSL